MANLTIPEKFHEGMLVLLSLDEAAVEAIAGTLLDVPASASTKKLSASVSRSLKTFTSTQIYQALRALRSLYGVFSNSEMSLKAFLQNLVPALQDVSATPFSSSEKKDIIAKFSKLLGVEDVTLYAKIRNLKTSDERSFCKARMNTDARPIFINGEEEPRGFFLVHRLQIGFHQADGKHHDFYISLDDDDVKSLKFALDQAEKKVVRLQAGFNRIS